MSKKKYIRKFSWNLQKKRICDQIDCNEPGEYKAPKSTLSQETYYFCLNHVRDYNKRWNFFAGKSQNQIYDFLKSEPFISKPTKPMSETINSKIDFDFTFGYDDFFRSEENKFTKNKEDKYDEALKIFQLKIPFDSLELKKRYKDLVRKNHPDLFQGDIKKEKLLKKINIYYKVLTKIAR